jgi:hypothetical protein
MAHAPIKSEASNKNTPINNAEPNAFAFPHIYMRSTKTSSTQPRHPPHHPGCRRPPPRNKVSNVTYTFRTWVLYLVITLQRCEIFAGFGEFTLLHTLTDVPVDKGTLGVHEVELVRESRPGLADGSRVGQHAHGAVDRCEITVGDVLGWLVADTNLESSRAPVDELHGALGLEVGNGSVGVLGDHVTTVQQAGSHVLSVARIALDHLVVGLEAGVGDLHDRVGLVGSLGSGNDGGVSNEREVDTGVGDQVGLELVQIDVQGAIESERSSDGRDD